MTNLEALKARLPYPFTDANSLLLCLTDRGIEDAAIYTVGQSFDLAYADAICILLMLPNVSEGGFSISYSDKETLKKIADGIYMKYGVVNPLSAGKPKATFKNYF